MGSPKKPVKTSIDVSPKKKMASHEFDLRDSTVITVPKSERLSAYKKKRTQIIGS